jgi:hypothetical protein
MGTIEGFSKIDDPAQMKCPPPSSGGLEHYAKLEAMTFGRLYVILREFPGLH